MPQLPGRRIAKDTLTMPAVRAADGEILRYPLNQSLPWLD
jgi:hypothetical protein